MDSNERRRGTSASGLDVSNDANYVPWKYTAQHPLVFFSPDLPDLVKDWQTNGGEQIRKEYAESIAASGSTS